MASRDPLEVFENPGRLYISPSNVTSAPFGGTEIGYVDQVAIQFSQDEYEPIPAEEFGGHPQDLVYRGTGEGLASISFSLKQYDADALNRIFPDTISESDGTRTIRTGVKRPGLLMASDGIGLLFAPDDPGRPAWYAPRAIGAPDATAELAGTLVAEQAVGAVFLLMPSTLGSAAYWVTANLANAGSYL